MEVDGGLTLENADVAIVNPAAILGPVMGNSTILSEALILFGCGWGLYCTIRLRSLLCQEPGALRRSNGKRTGQPPAPAPKLKLSSGFPSKSGVEKHQCAGGEHVVGPFSVPFSSASLEPAWPRNLT
jgi:hypothetical protein